MNLRWTLYDYERRVRAVAWAYPNGLVRAKAALKRPHSRRCAFARRNWRWPGAGKSQQIRPNPSKSNQKKSDMRFTIYERQGVFFGFAGCGCKRKRWYLRTATSSLPQ